MSENSISWGNQCYVSCSVIKVPKIAAVNLCASETANSSKWESFLDVQQVKSEEQKT